MRCSMASPARERKVPRSLSWGVAVAGHLGVFGGLVIRDREGKDVTAATRAEVGAERFDAVFAEANRTLEWQLLAGPSDAELAELPKLAKGQEIIRRAAQQRAQQERDQAARLAADDRWRRGRLRDVISAREFTFEWIDQITRAVMARDTTIGELVGSRVGMRAFAEDMPSSRVVITLKTRCHRDAQHTWTANDIYDIDAMAVAVPYCDAVFADKSARRALSVSPEIGPLGMFLPPRPDELADWIDRLRSSNA